MTRRQSFKVFALSGIALTTRTTRAEQIKPQPLNDPQAFKDLGDIRGIANIARLTGSVNGIRIGHINDLALVDTTQLLVNDIVIDGDVNGRANVLLNSQGNVTINGCIDGRSIVVINAKGRVTLRQRVDGRSRLRIKAAELVINEWVTGGPCTQVYYDVSRPELGGGVRGDSILHVASYTDADVFDFQGDPFVQDCGQQDPDEQGNFRIPQRAANLRSYLSNGDWAYFSTARREPHQNPGR